MIFLQNADLKFVASHSQQFGGSANVKQNKTMEKILKLDHACDADLISWQTLAKKIILEWYALQTSIKFGIFLSFFSI